MYIWHSCLSEEYHAHLDELLKILICPKTGSKLLFDKEKNELVSKKAKLAYPIKDNIPILLENEARKLS